MPTANEILRAAYLRVLCIAPVGAGKTEFLATAPNPAIADYDNGMRTVIAPGFKKRHPEIDLSTIRFETFQDEMDANGIPIKAQALQASMRWLNEQLQDDSVESLGLDTLTSMSALAANISYELNAQTGKSKTLANAKAAGGIPFLISTQADMGSEMGIIQQIFDKLTSSLVEKHVFVMAHERVTQDKNGMVIAREPLITGNKLRASIGRWFDEVWYLDVIGSGEDAERVLYTASDGIKKSLKSRSGLPERISNPTIPKILEMLEEV